MQAKPPHRRLPWVLLFALVVILAALIVLYLMADPGARIPSDVGYGGERVEPVSAASDRIPIP